MRARNKTMLGRTASGVLAATVLLGMATLTGASAGVAGTEICAPGAWSAVHSASGKVFYLRNPYINDGGAGGQTCITATGGTGFKVTQVQKSDGHVNAFPDVMTGCIWQVCTPRTNLPVRVRNIERLQSTWHTRSFVPGMHNASYELWLGTHRENADGSATRDGAELMIWLNYPSGDNAYLHTKRHKKVRIAGYTWYQLHWHGCDKRIGVCWNYISYRLVHMRRNIDDLNLKAFLDHSRRLGLIEPRWWLQSVGAGFEIWSGGRGLASTQFNVALRKVS